MSAGVSHLDVCKGFGHATGWQAFVFALAAALRYTVAAHGV